MFDDIPFDGDAAWQLDDAGGLATFECTMQDWIDHGRAIVAKFSPRLVWLPGRRPCPGPDGFTWHAFDDAEEDDALCLPWCLRPELFSHLPLRPGDGEHYRRFDTVEEADEALSAACLACAGAGAV
jgi:hypothetical protein